MSHISCRGEASSAAEVIMITNLYNLEVSLTKPIIKTGANTFTNLEVLVDNILVSQLADGIAGQLITWDVDGSPTVVTGGTLGQVLTYTGSIPSWETNPSGDVTKVGIPANNQIGVWTGDGTIEGANSLIYDGSNLQLTGDIGSTGIKITKGWFTDLEVTNDITINGNALATIYAGIAQTMYIGTTQVAINRASAALTLAGITLTTPNIGTPSAGVLTNCTGLPVAGGGTGVSTLTTAYGLLAAGTTATGVVQTLAAGTATQILVGGGASALPVWGANLPTAVTIGSAYIYRVAGTDVAVTDGGTGLSVYAVGDIVYASATTTLARLADVAAGQPLLSGGVDIAPAYAGYTLSGTAAQTYTFPGASQTLASLAGTETLTNKNIQRSINAQTVTTYEFVVADAGKVVTFNNASAVTVTVPANASVSLAIGTQIDCIQTGVGKTIFAVAGGVTINSKDVSLANSAQYAGVTLLKTGTDVWVLVGDLVACSTYGYFAGGYRGSYVVTADRIVFSTGVTSANTVSDLSQARRYLAALSDGSTYGYFAGGDTGTRVATADRIVFSTGVTSANTVSDLSQARSYLAALSDGITYGYFAGGYTGAAVATADRIVFSTGATSANTVSDLSQARYGLVGLSDGSTYGYFAGGYTDAVVATADRIVFSTGATSANTVSDLSQARYAVAGLSDGSTYGYFAGGNTGTKVATADRIVFSTGVTSANTVSDLSQARTSLAGLSDGSTYGYFAGGDTGGYVATADRIVFSTGATSANTVSDLSQARSGLAGLSDFAV